MEYVLRTLKLLCPRLKFTNRTYSIITIGSKKIPASSLPGILGHLPPSPGVSSAATLTSYFELLTTCNIALQQRSRGFWALQWSGGQPR